MGNVVVKLKIMPSSVDVDIEKLKKEIEKRVKVQDSKIEPIAFGLKALKIIVIIPDSEGTEKLENKLKVIKGVEDVDVESVTLL